MRESGPPDHDAWASDALGAAQVTSEGQPGRGFTRVLLVSGAAAALIAVFVASLAVSVRVSDDLVLARAAGEEPDPGPVIEPGPPVIVLADAAPVASTDGPRFDARVCPEGPSQRVRCGYLDVPESRSADDGRRVRIAVSIREASAVAPDPIVPRRAVVVLGGGPGAPMLDAAWEYQSSAALGAGDVDVIVIDQRGVGRSVPTLVCPGFGIGNLTSLPSAPEDHVACAVRSRLLGVDPAAFTSRESAADIADLRTVLGYDVLDLVGLSYGTRLALEVVRHHPEAVRSIVLAGPLPPGAPDLSPALSLARVVVELDAVCDLQPGCSDAFGPLDALLVAAMRRAESDGGSALISELSGALFMGAYWVDGLVTVPRALAAAADGDWDAVRSILPGIATLPSAPAAGTAPTSGPYDELESTGLFLSVHCADSDGQVVADADAADAPVRQRIAAAGASRAYREVLDLTGSNLGSMCRTWGLPLGTAPRSAVESDVPALVLSGRFDPTTPPRLGEIAAATLPRAHVVVAPHLAHGLILADSCVDGIVAEFLAQPDTTPAIACLDAMPLPAIQLP